MMGPNDSDCGMCGCQLGTHDIGGNCPVHGACFARLMMTGQTTTAATPNTAIMPGPTIQPPQSLQQIPSPPNVNFSPLISSSITGSLFGDPQGPRIVGDEMLLAGGKLRINMETGEVSKSDDLPLSAEAKAFWEGITKWACHSIGEGGRCSCECTCNRKLGTAEMLYRTCSACDVGVHKFQERQGAFGGESMSKGPATIKVLHVQWFRETPLKDVDGNPVYPPQVDGQVIYELLHPDGSRDYTDQPFMRAPAGAKNYLDVRGRKTPVWSWDGNRDAPSLTPSYEVFFPPRPDVEPVKLHMHLTQGRIVLSGDSVNVVLPPP